MEGAHSEKELFMVVGMQQGKSMIDFMANQSMENTRIIENRFVYELLLDGSKKKCIGVKG